VLRLVLDLLKHERVDIPLVRLAQLTAVE
jgi:hypothetical protein